MFQQGARHFFYGNSFGGWRVGLRKRSECFSDGLGGKIFFSALQKYFYDYWRVEPLGHGPELSQKVSLVHVVLLLQ